MRTMRQRGFTLIEVSCALSVCVILFGTIGVVCNKLLDGVIDVRQQTQARIQNSDGIQSIVDDLVTSNALGTDPGGNPYLAIEKTGGGRGDTLKIRKVNGFSADETSDIVNVRYSSEVKIYVDSYDRLVRDDGTNVKVLAHKINEVKFERNSSGNISLELESYRGKKGEPDYKEFEREITLTPRNGFDR